MYFHQTIADLLDYTDWDRRQWFEWMSKRDAGFLRITAGTGGDGRFENVGDLVRHIFSAEKRWIDRLVNRPITDTATVPNDNVEGLFAFGRESRRDLREYLETLSAEDAATPQEFTLMNQSFQATPKKIVTHVLMHEVRHWAQIATVLRLNGLKVDMHDFLFSPVMGAELLLGA
ncbi:MAG TPA: DinB family protein [Verrucomicrobiae bacterium]|nr:DinB family protein [Verrucomicrobiae bacterium]